MNCLFDPNIFDPNIFDTCASVPSTPGAAGGGEMPTRYTESVRMPPPKDEDELLLIFLEEL